MVLTNWIMWNSKAILICSFPYSTNILAPSPDPHSLHCMHNSQASYACIAVEWGPHQDKATDWIG